MFALVLNQGEVLAIGPARILREGLKIPGTTLVPVVEREVEAGYEPALDTTRAMLLAKDGRVVAVTYDPVIAKRWPHQVLNSNTPKGEKQW